MPVAEGMNQSALEFDPLFTSTVLFKICAGQALSLRIKSNLMLRNTSHAAHPLLRDASSFAGTLLQADRAAACVQARCYLCCDSELCFVVATPTRQGCRA